MEKTMGTETVAVYAQNDKFENTFIFPTLFEMIGEPRGKRILDYGCGEGDLASLLASKGADVMGVDVSDSMLESARSQSHPNLRFAKLYDNKIPAFDESIDVIVSNLVFVMVPELSGIRKIVQECHRVLRQDGRLVFNITNPAFVDKDFRVYRNIFEDGFNYNNSGSSYQFVLKTADGKEITDKGFRDYHYRWDDYINAVADSGLRLLQVKEVCIPDAKYPPFVVFCGEK